MARSDLILRLAEVASRGDRDGVRRAVEALAADERDKQHHIIAERLMRALQLNGNGRRPAQESSGLLVERSPQRTLADLRLADDVRSAAMELVEEHQRVELLRSHGMEPRHRILLVGPPGNGKTSLAEAIAGELGRPLLTPAYHRVVGSLLGETAKSLGKVFDEVASRACVLFLDEIDVVAKERGDLQETGEIKRVVATLLLGIDELPPHVVIVGATNHPDLLDRAAWRRFEVRLELAPPDRKARVAYITDAAKGGSVKWGVSPEAIADALEGSSYGELEQFVANVRRRIILEQPKDGRNVVRRCMRRWEERAGPKHA